MQSEKPEASALKTVTRIWEVGFGSGETVSQFLDSGLLDSAGPFSSPIDIFGVSSSHMTLKKKIKNVYRSSAFTQQASLPSGVQVCDLDKCGQPSAAPARTGDRFLPSTQNAPGCPFVSASSPTLGPGSCPSIFSLVSAV